MSIRIVLLIGLVFETSLAGAQVRREAMPPNLLRRTLHTTPIAGPHPRAIPTPSAVARPALPPNVTLATCPEPNSVCGYVLVPLDRNHPQGKKIGIYFEQYFHSNRGPAVSAILVNLGGPGVATTPNRDYFQYGLFAANMDAHDLLLVDNRGQGMSGAINCSELQHGTASFIAAEQNCAAQLGTAASRYGSGDIAEDMNDVREALGYDLIDYLGASAGGADAIAFATRFPEHLRSLVLDAPIGPPNVSPYTRLQSFQAHALPDVISNLCKRSLLCAPDHPDVAGELSQLIQSVRAHPVEGDSYDVDGNPAHVQVDERTLLDFVVRGNFNAEGEIPAAFTSLENGDAAPLLRLAAEGFYTLNSDSGDPTEFSAGAYFATGCSYMGQTWDWSDPVAKRMRDDNEFRRKLPDDYYSPFSKAVGRDLVFNELGRQCLWWEEPTPASPIVLPHATYPAVPTLVVVGDLDDVVPTAASRVVAELFPNSRFVTVANSRHEATGWTQCGAKLASEFIESLAAGNAECASTPEYIFPAVGRFPILARYARPAHADSSGTNRIDVAERKVVSVAVATAADALQRFYIGSGFGVGLRGGTFSTNSDAFPVFKITLKNCAFSQDVIVNGKINWTLADGSMTADLAVSGAGTSGGTLHVTGFWNGNGPLHYFHVNGALGGKHLAVLVPEG